MKECTTFTDEYVPAGFVHVGHLLGLSYSLRESLDWAKGFALSLATESIAA